MNVRDRNLLRPRGSLDAGSERHEFVVGNNRDWPQGEIRHNLEVVLATRCESLTECSCGLAVGLPL